MQPGEQRTSVRVGTSIAFADGKFGWGAPVHGGYAIVYPHDTLKDKEIIIGTKDHVRGKVDGWGAAVVSNLPVYSQTNVTYDVDNLPIGYSLGSGGFDLRAPHGGGYALMVGSGYSVSAYGSLVDTAGQPLKLLSGVAFPEGNRGKEVTVITNADGRFAAEGLAPGGWVIEMSGDTGTLTYKLDVPKGTDGLIRAGVLRPVGYVGGSAYARRSGNHAEKQQTSTGWEATSAGADTSGQQTVKLRGMQ